MALSVQNLRAVGTGVEPNSLLPGQIAFNITDKVLYVGDGSAFKTNFDGTQVPGTPGNGWYAMPMDFDSLGDYYVQSPQYYGDIPTDQQVLAWSTALNHPIWISGSGGGGSQVYVVTNAQVASAPGATTSAKITAAIGVASPDEGNVVIVTGLPDEVYEGLYFFTTEWVKGAAYAYPSASEVIYDNVAHPTLTATVQGAIDDLDDGLIATTAIANTANSTANSALSIASAALPRAGGTMTGTIVAQNINVQTGYGVQFNAGAAGTINGINDSINATSSTVAASGTAVKAAYDIGAAALPRTGGVMTGDITFQDSGEGVIFSDSSSIFAISDSVATTSSTSAASSTAVKTAYDLASAAVPRSSFVSSGDLLVGTGAGTFSPLPAGAADYILASDGLGNLLWVPDSEGDVTGIAVTAPITVDNLDPQVPVIGVDLATTANPGVVQIDVLGHISLVGGVIGVPASSTANKGVVQLNNTLASTSVFEALTAAQGKALQDQIDSLTFANSVTLAGGYNATTGLVDGATSQGIAAGFLDGNPPPTPGAGNLDYYLICTTSGPLPSTMQNGDWLLSDGTQYVVLGVGARPQSASYTQAGIVQLADPAAVLLGTSDTTAITPESLQDNVLDSVTTANSNQIASSTAVKTAYDAAVAAQTTANAALPKAGGTMTGNITFQDPGEGVVFNGGSQVFAISDSTSTTSSTTAASSTAVKAAKDAADAAQSDADAAQATADAALPKAGGTMTGNITFQDAGEGVVFNGGSTIIGISDATGNTNSDIAASSTAVKDAYALANTANTTANAAVPCASFTALGNLLVGTGSGTYSALGVGTNQQVLLADNTCATGLKWGNACYVPDACFTTKGQLIVGTGAGTYVALTPGSNGQLLVPNSACTNGVEWVTCQGASLCGFTCTLTPFNTALGSLAGAALTGLSVANTAIGYAALDAETSGDFNVAVGHNALTAQNGATGNTAVGANAGAALTGGASNILIGYGAGDSLTIGAQNVAIGRDALGSSTGASNSVAVGHLALTAVSTGGNNVGVGAAAGAQVNSGASNTLVGATAGDCVTSGSFNVALGFNSLGAASTNGNNVAVGSCALAVSTAPNLVAVGHNSLLSNTSGTANTALGYTALSLNITGSQSTAVGFGAGQCVSGNANTLIGYNAGNDITTGVCNTILGSVTGSTTLSCNLILAAASTIKFQANASGAWSYNGTDFGTAGQFLTSQGSAATPVWCTLSLACVPCAAFTAAGQLLAGTGTSTFTALTVGGDGQFLVADSTCTGGLKWATECFINDSSFTGTGAILAGTGVGSFSALPVGTNGQSLLVDLTCATGLKWGQSLSGYTCAATPFNTAVGTNAGDSITTGVNNTSLGYNAGTAITIGLNNTFVGFDAGDGITSSDNNVAVGSRALSNTGGNNNTAVGYCTGGGLTSGGQNTFIGGIAGYRATTLDCAVAVGYGAMGGVATGTGQVAVGVNALNAMTSGACNVAVGFNAGAAVTTGSNNTMLGYAAGDTVTTGTQNTFLGSGSGGLAATTSEGNTGVGFSALGQGVTSGAYNTALGNSAGLSVTSGAINTLVGYSAGSAITTGGSNTLVGRYAGTATLANNVVLSDGAGTIRFQSNASGAISLGAGGAYGTAGQVLTSGGAGAAPTWAAPASAAANYGAFSSSATQTNAGGVSGQAVTLNTTASSNGFSIVSGSQITATTAGTYNIQIRLQVEKTVAGTDTVEVWFKKNGADIANSNTYFGITDTLWQEVSLNLVETLTAGQYLEVWWFSGDTSAQLRAIAAGARPAVPSAIVTVVPVGA